MVRPYHQKTMTAIARTARASLLTGRGDARRSWRTRPRARHVIARPISNRIELAGPQRARDPRLDLDERAIGVDLGHPPGHRRAQGVAVLWAHTVVGQLLY